MKKIILSGVVLSALLGSYAMADSFDCSIKLGLFGSETKAMSKTKIDITQAVVAAKKVVEGRAIGAKLEEENGCLVYRVKIIDSKGNKHKVYIDPVNSKMLESLLD
jgi:uncharacterized membrane protein YkoI